jgi:hypothetical protein
VGKGLKCRLSLRNRRRNIRVGVDGSREPDRDSQSIAASRDQLRTNTALLLGPDLVHEQHGQEGMGAFFQELRGGRVDLPDAGD